MKRYMGVLGAMAFALSPHVLGDVSVYIGEGTELIAVNGKVLDQEERVKDRKWFHLENGTIQLVVEHVSDIRESASESLLDTSDTHVLLFEEQDVELRLKTPDIDSRSDMRRFNRTPQWRLTDGQGQEINYVADLLEKEGFQLGRNYQAELDAFNRSGAAAALALPSEAHNATGLKAGEEIQMTSPPSLSPSAYAEDTDQDMVGKVLKFWYQKASSTTRNDFKNWLEEDQ